MSEENGVLRFKKQRARKEIVLEDGDQEEKFILVEMMGPEREEWLNQHAKRMKIGSDGKPIGISDFKGLFPSLICRCMFREDGTKIAVAEVNAWGGALQQAIFTECRKLNGFEEPEEVKKD